MLTEKQIEGIQNVRKAIKYHDVMLSSIWLRSADYQGTDQHRKLKNVLIWTLQQCFTQEELDSVKE